MASDKNIVKQRERILYVEPNDIYGDINGIPMTPDYSDYCISVNLIAEVVSRFRQSGEDLTKEYIMTYSVKPYDESSVNWVSFLQGEDAKKYGGREGTLLTTYYTDINYDDIVKNNIVEGLGIESIQVSFESYYTPTVIIKFVDVRGSSLFGREESVHESGENLSSSSVFGVFFTIPYPKFKLQIKGYYGHAVTYQLTCSDFKASFNSHTGNFEAVVTFIGYSYSLLTDIPLRYLVAAPYCNYIGQSYWEGKLHSTEWALSDGNTPQKLLYIIEKVKSLITNTDDVKRKLMTDEEFEKKTNIQSEKTLLSELSVALKNYVVALKKLNQTSQSLDIIDTEDGEQLILFAPEPSGENVGNFKIGQVGDEIALTSMQLINAFDNYNDAYSNKAFGAEMLPNGKHGSFGKYDSLEFSRLCQQGGVSKNATNGIIDKIIFNCTEQSENGIMSIPLNNGNKLIRSTAHRLYTDAKKKDGLIPKYFGEFCYVVNLNHFLSTINERINALNVDDREIDKKIAEKVQTVASLELNFTPCIGDIFKIIMCHLETFIHMMWGCYRIIDDDIKNGRRKPDVLGVSLDNTDIILPPDSKNKDDVLPWPGIFGRGTKTKECGDDATTDSIAWIGDFSHNFEEEKLVTELYKAAQKVGDLKDSEPKPLSMTTGLPIMPSDLNDSTSIFNQDIQDGISGLTGYLSFRAAQIFGILMNNDASVELAKTIGIMDAYNYFSYSQSKSDIKNTLLEPTSNKGSLSDVMFSVAHCEKPGEDGFYGATYEETGRSVHDFETTRNITYTINGNKVSIDRHPMFVKNGNKSRYVHYYMKNGTGLVPDRLKAYPLYKDTFDCYASKDDTYFIFKKKSVNTNSFADTNGFLHKSNTEVLFKSLGEEYTADSYLNDDMFDVNVDEKFATDVINKYLEMKAGTINIFGDTFNDNLSIVLDKFWHVKNEDYGKYFGNNSFMLSATVADRGIKQDELYPKTMSDANNNENAPKSINNSKIFDITGGGVKFNSSNNAWVDESGNEKPISNLCIRFLQSNYPKGSNYGYENLFASSFYYYQNDKIFKNGDNDDETKMKIRQTKVKALIFLHSLKYDYKLIADFLNSDKTCGGIYTLPYGYILLLGGLLWREKYYRLYGVDPIQTSVDGAKYMEYNSSTDKLEEKSGVNPYKEVKIPGTSTLATLFCINDENYVLCPLKKTDNKDYSIRVADLFGMKGTDSEWLPDQYVTNRLILIFERFAGANGGEWTSKLMNSLELKDCILKNNSRTIIPYSGKTFENEASIFKQDFDECKNATNGSLTMLTYLREQERYFFNFIGNYRYITVNESGHILMLLNDENTVVQNTLKDIYTRKVTVQDSSGIRHIYNGSNDVKDIEINSESFKAYLSGFEYKIKEIVNNKRADVVNEYGDNVTLKKDLLLPIYLYLKTIWDRWLVSSTTKKQKNGTVINYEDYYNVENFYKSFIFIDAFYKNIYKNFIINLETLKKSYIGRDENASLYQFIGDITTKHSCLFLALPDYVGMGNADNEKAIESMYDMFRPIPYNEMNGIDDENRFVIIYTPRMSEIPLETNGYKSDYFRIWNPATNTWEEDKKIEKVFEIGSVNTTNNTVTRYGYYVPSFGVAFSRQNNHLFKSINVNMSTPLATSASINASANIAMKGAGVQYKAAFMGQDLYPVFSNYSYICEVEMMGDAQIQPLMYFQLMNIPMWSGVYMILNVTHTITAGNMTTKFNGVKLSRNPLPYNSSWYMFNPDRNDESAYENNRYDSSGSSIDITVVDGSTYKRTEGDISSHYDDMENYVNEGVWKTRSTAGEGNSQVLVSEKLKTLYNKLYEEIKAYQEQNGGKMTWNVGFSSIGHGTHKNTSQHYRGYAMDLQLTRFDATGKCKGVDTGKDKTSDSKYFIVMDILYSLHFDEIYQNIYEVYETSQYFDPVRQYMPKCLHVGIKENANHNTQFFADNGNFGNYKFTNGVLLPEFKGIASKHYKSNKSTFKSVFINFNAMTDSQIEAMLGL